MSASRGSTSLPTGAPAPYEPLVTPPKPGRAELRASKRRRQRRWALVLLVVAAVVAGGLRWNASQVPTEPAPAGPTSSGEPVAPASVVLVQVRDAQGAAAVQALVADDPATRKAAVLLVPSGLVVPVAGVGSLPLGQVSTLPGASRSADALTDLLAVRVQGTWSLSEAALAGLVDAVGGLQTDVDTDVLRDGVVVVPEGSQRLDGTAAVAWATYSAPGDPEALRLARFKDVLAQVLAALPEDRGELAAIVERTTAQAPSTLAADELTDVLSRWRAGAAAAGTMSFETLPTRTLDTGSGTFRYGLDEAAAAARLAELFPPSVIRSGAERTRVLVQNGARIPGLTESARGRLVEKDYAFVDGGNSEAVAADSVVLVKDAGLEARSRGEAVAAALGLPASSLRVATAGQNVADVIVVLGSDYEP